MKKWLRIPRYWDMTSYHWVTCNRIFVEDNAFIFKGPWVREKLFWNLQTLEIYPVARCHNQEERRPLILSHDAKTFPNIDMKYLNLQFRVNYGIYKLWFNKNIISGHVQHMFMDKQLFKICSFKNN